MTGPHNRKPPGVLRRYWCTSRPAGHKMPGGWPSWWTRRQRRHRGAGTNSCGNQQVPQAGQNHTLRPAAKKKARGASYPTRILAAPLFVAALAMPRAPTLADCSGSSGFGHAGHPAHVAEGMMDCAQRPPRPRIAGQAGPGDQPWLPAAARRYAGYTRAAGARYPSQAAVRHPAGQSGSRPPSRTSGPPPV